MTASCPDSALLRGLLAGGLEADAEARLRSHVDTCAGCRGRLATLPGGTDWNASPLPAVDTTPGDDGLEPAGHPERIGEFRVLREIGRGGMGVVYEAEQASLGRRVALKVLPAISFLDRTLVERFKREAQAAARLHHTNIVPVHGAGEERGLHYFAMEYIDGQGLDRVLRELRAERARAGAGKPADVPARTARSLLGSSSSGLPSPNTERLQFYRRIAGLAVQAADGLAYAHAHGVVHRDIKPSNLILDHNSTLWITDFGLAKAEGVDPLTQSGDVLGTLGYMAPEGFRGTADERGDIYGLGITLYELLTLRPAFHDADRQRLIKRVSEEEPPAPRRIEALIPRDLETIVLKAIHKDPQSRYAKASQFADDLRSFLLDRPIRARRTTLIERGWRWCRRNRAIAALVACVGLVSAIAAVTGWHSWRAGEARRLSDLKREGESSFWEAQRLFGAGQYEAALSHVTRSVASHPTHAARLLKARALVALEKIDEGAALLDAMLAENPEDGAAHYLLATVHRGRDERLSRYHQANAERLLEDSAEAFHLRALTAPGLAAARDWLDRALRLDPAHFPSLKSRALAHLAIGDYEAMERDAYAVVSHRPAEAFNWSLLAFAKARRGRPEEAVVDLNRALKIDPENLEFHKQRRAVHRLLGDHRAELEDALKVVELEPRSVVNDFHLVAARLANGQVAEAAETYRQCTGASWSVKRWFDRTLGRQVFEDRGLPGSSPPAAGDSELLAIIENYRRIYRDLAGRARRVARDTFKASLSPDGSQLVYDSVILETPRLDSATYLTLAVPRSLRIVDLATGNDRLLVEDGKDASWSPDGRRIAFVRRPVAADRNSEEVWVIDVPGGEARRLAKGGYPTWSTDPGRVYFQSRELRKLCAIEVAGPGAALQVLCPCESHYPAISPDGRFFAEFSGVEMRVIEVASQGIVSRWRPPQVQEGGLTEWSPDGREVSVGCAQYAEFGLWIFDRESATARLAFRGPVTLGTWSRDRRRFAATVRGEVFEAWVADLDPARSTAEALAPTLTEEEYLGELEEEARREVARRTDDPVRRRRLARALESGKKHREAAAAYRAASELAAKADSTDLEAAARNLAYAGDLAAAVRELEDVADTVNRGKDALVQLIDLRERLLPRFASYASIDAAFLHPVTLLSHGAVWRYFRGVTEPPADWKEVGFDDTSWPAGELGIGYGRQAAGLRRLDLDDMSGKYSTVYLRREFTVEERFRDYSLAVHADDGFVCFLNGTEVARWRAGGSGKAVQHQDTASLPAPEPLDRRVFGLPSRLLRPGPNVLAVVGLNKHIQSPDFFLLCTLRARWRNLPEDGPLEGFLKLAPGTGAEDLSLLQDYAHARRDQWNGRHREALAGLEGVAARDAAAPEPHLHAAECLRALGDREGARARLRAALGTVRHRRRELWDLWWFLSAGPGQDGAGDVTRILAEIPEEAEPRSGYGTDLRESLEALAESGCLRLNCGGERFTSANGATWLGDRFFTCGFPYTSGPESYGAPEPFRGEIAGTADDALYQTERWFSPDFEANSGGEGYRIPLLPGDYRVTLHFAEILHRRPERRLFEVALEEQTLIGPLDLFAEAGFACAASRQTDLSVRDGFLDVRFIRSWGEPQVAALEVERLPAK